jgi:transposase-like protein
MPRHPDPATTERWQQRLRHFARSGLTVTAFCAREGIAPATFHAWKRRLRDAAAPQFVPVRLTEPSAATPVELVLPSGCVLRLAPGCDPAWVRQLLDLLGVPPC